MPNWYVSSAHPPVELCSNVPKPWALDTYSTLLYSTLLYGSTWSLSSEFKVGLHVHMSEIKT